MLEAASATAGLLQYVLGGGFLVGFAGAVVALFKLRPDIDSQAVVQAQGAMSAMKEAIDRIEKERDYWQKRCEDCEQRQRHRDTS